MGVHISLICMYLHCFWKINGWLWFVFKLYFDNSHEIRGRKRNQICEWYCPDYYQIFNHFGSATNWDVLLTKVYYIEELYYKILYHFWGVTNWGTILNKMCYCTANIYSGVTEETGTSGRSVQVISIHFTMQKCRCYSKPL